MSELRASILVKEQLYRGFGLIRGIRMEYKGWNVKSTGFHRSHLVAENEIQIPLELDFLVGLLSEALFSLLVRDKNRVWELKIDVNKPFASDVLVRHVRGNLALHLDDSGCYNVLGHSFEHIDDRWVQPSVIIQQILSDEGLAVEQEQMESVSKMPSRIKTCPKSLTRAEWGVHIGRGRSGRIKSFVQRCFHFSSQVWTHMAPLRGRKDRRGALETVSH